MNRRLRAMCLRIERYRKRLKHLRNSTLSVPLLTSVDVLYAIALILEGARRVKALPAAVLALIGSRRRAYLRLEIESRIAGAYAYGERIYVADESVPRSLSEARDDSHAAARLTTNNRCVRMLLYVLVERDK